MHHGEFRDPRLAQIYDVNFRWSRDDDFFLAVVNETPAARVLDLGCGTGRLALALAEAGHTVTGVDPARASLDIARSKPGAERVTWREGASAELPAAEFDVAVMTSHVAQFMVGDDEWGRCLADLHRSLVPGGRLVFDTRDPRARRWERWNPVESHRELTLPDGREVAEWTEVTAAHDGLVDLTHHYVFSGGGELTGTATMRFRSEPEIRASLGRAGFVVEQIYGGWSREPVGQGEGELIVVASRRILH